MISSTPYLLGGDPLRLESLGQWILPPRQSESSFRPGPVALDPRVAEVVQRFHLIAVNLALEEKPHYGINTGFGPLCNVKIDASDVEKLQENLIVSHAMGVGAPLAPTLVRLIMATKINALSRGHSGVSPELLDLLVAMLNADVLPVIPEQGSVGASGDLAPLAHLGLAIIGQGNVMHHGASIKAADALLSIARQPHRMRPKEALALINGTQFMAAHGVLAMHLARRLAKTADIVAALSLEALRGSIRPFDERLGRVRAHPGHLATASNIRRLAASSEVLGSHRGATRVQDPYSLRCVPQVHGACRDALVHASEVIEREINSVTDNPVLFEPDDAISGGNFHGEPLALVLDYAALAIAELASISERRTYLLLEGRDGLPKLLLRETGLNSGFMIPQYTAAALVSENKVLAHPASVDSIPTSLGQEDHVSMGSISATKLLRVLRNAENVLAIEAMCASQALDFRAPARPGRGTETAHAVIRQAVPHATEDRLFNRDLVAIAELVRTGQIVASIESDLGALE